MSQKQSDQMRECLSHTNENTVGHSSRGESRNQHSPTDPTATSQATASENSRETKITIKELKTMEKFSTELNQPILVKGHTVLIDVRIMQLHPQFLYCNLFL